jgi:hypothetical protein
LGVANIFLQDVGLMLSTFDQMDIAKIWNKIK